MKRGQLFVVVSALCVTEVRYVLMSMDGQWTVSAHSFNSTHPNRAAAFAPIFSLQFQDGCY